MWKFFAKEVLLEIVRPLVIPAVVAGGGTVIGVLSGLPFYYLYIGAVVLFAYTVTGLLRFNEWKYRITPEFKLSFGSPGFRIKKLGDALEIMLSIQIQNAATFPITFQLMDISTRLGEFYPPKKAHEPDTFTISPDRNVDFEDFAIRLDSPPEGQQLEGIFEIKISYGRAGGRLSYFLTTKKKVVISFSDKGVALQAEWEEIG